MHNRLTLDNFIEEMITATTLTGQIISNMYAAKVYTSHEPVDIKIMLKIAI